MNYQVNPSDYATTGVFFITGITIAPSWFIYLKRPNEKPHTNAILILGDIVRRYQELPHGGSIQCQYQDFMDDLGFSKKQVRAACHFLEDQHLIELDFRTVEEDGYKVGNVLFINLNVGLLHKITYGVE